MHSLKEKNFEAYLATELSNLAGQWVIFCDGDLVAHDQNLKNAILKARQLVGDRRLLIAKVHNKETMIYAT